MMLLSHAIKQITAPNWWNNPVMPWKSNRKRLNEMAEQRDLFFKAMLRKRKPATMAQLAKEHDCTIAAIRALADPYVKAGTLIRAFNSDGKVTLEKAK